MTSQDRVSNEKKNLTRLAGEFLIASRLTQRGYMVTLQWGNTISYDILAFDKHGKVAFIEVKSTASNPRRWVLQSNTRVLKQTPFRWKDDTCAAWTYLIRHVNR